MHPDDRTRPLPPTSAVPPPHGVAPAPASPPLAPGAREVIVEDRRAWSPVLLEERLDSLRTWLAVLTFISVLALGLSVYAIIVAGEDDDTSTRRGASVSRVNSLDDRVDDLEQRLGNRATRNSVASLETAQSDLAKRIQALEGRPADDGGDDAAAQDVTRLRTDLDTLSKSITDTGTAIEQLDDRVAELENAQQTP